MAYNPEIAVGDLIAAFTVAISAFMVWRTLRKDRDDRQAERADKIRAAAAMALRQLDRWQLLNLSLYEKLQTVFVETSEFLYEEFNIFRARDYLWKEINRQRAQVRQSISDEMISTSYVELLPHFPFWRKTFQEALQELDAIEEYIYWQLLAETQEDVQSFADKEDTYTSAELGNYLRTTAEAFRQELMNKTNDRITPIRTYLEEVIVLSDLKILQQNLKPPAEIERDFDSVRTSNGVILWLGANPRDSVRLNIKEETEAIRRRLEYATGAFEIIEKWAVSADDLQSLLMKHRPAFVHMSGHGNSDGEIELHSSRLNMSVPVPNGAITALFKLLGQKVQCVVLNACYSKTQGEAIANHVGCVVGMSDKVSDRTAIEFSSAFYDALSHGETIRNSFEIAINRLDLNEEADVDVPVLIDPFNRAKKLIFRPEPQDSGVVGG